MVLEVNEAGELILPPELVQAAPHTRLVADRTGEAVVLTPITEAGQRPSILSLPTFPAGPADSAMTFRREDIYNDDGR
jgi:hypothetical protein